LENLRIQTELDLHESLEGEWGMHVQITSPDGATQIYSKNNPDEVLKGQVLYFSKAADPETGEQIYVNQAVVTLRISSLDRVPGVGEKWFVKMPISPAENAPMENFTFTPTMSPQHGTDIGFMRFYPQRVENDSGPGVLDDEISYN
jgi:hypothetical protein